MDLIGLISVLNKIFLFLCVLYLYLEFKKPPTGKYSHYSTPGWNFDIKRLWAVYKINQWKTSEDLKIKPESEDANAPNDYDEFDERIFWGANKGSSLYVKLKRTIYYTDITLILNLNGTVYNLPITTKHDIKLSVIEPFKRWTLSYDGPMIDCDRFVDMKINLTWTASCEPINISSNRMMASAIALEPWTGPNWMDPIINHPIKGYDQYGTFDGIISNESENKLKLNVFHHYSWGVSPALFVRRYINLKCMLTDGTIFNLEIESNKLGLTQYKKGTVQLPDGSVSNIESMDLNIASIGEDPSDIHGDFQLDFKSNRRNFSMKVELDDNNRCIIDRENPLKWKSILIPVRLNSTEGCGLLELWYSHKFIK